MFAGLIEDRSPRLVSPPIAAALVGPLLMEATVPKPFDACDDFVPVTDLDRIEMAIAEIVAALRCPEVTVDAEGAVRMLADAVDLRVLAVPKAMMKRIDLLGDLLVDAIEGVGRREPELRPRLVNGIADRRRELAAVIRNWEDDHAARRMNAAEGLESWTFAPCPTDCNVPCVHRFTRTGGS